MTHLYLVFQSYQELLDTAERLPHSLDGLMLDRFFVLNHVDRIHDLKLKLVDGISYPATHGILVKALDLNLTECFAHHIVTHRMAIYEYIQRQLGTLTVSILCNTRLRF